MRIVIVGAGISGLTSALALGRAGHEVVVVERDATPMPTSPDEAFEWARRGAPQVRHSHAMLARLRNTLRDRAPDVLASLLDAGATEVRFTEHLPPTLTDIEARPGDEDLVGLACRRTTFEWVLRRHALAQPGVELRDGIVVRGLATDGDGRVCGVDTESGPVLGDLVVDACGPRSGSRAWLDAIGVEEPPEQLAECEIVYLSRFYRLHDGAEAPVVTGPVAGDLGYLKFAVFVGDNRTFSITIAADVHDQELRAGLADPEAFEAAVATLPAAQPWRDGRSEPITDVHVMAGLRNRRRALVVDGEPIVSGFVAVGDAATATNPLYGRGCSLALLHAFALADAISAHGTDVRAVAVALDEAGRRDVEPWYRSAVQQDQEAAHAAAIAAGRVAAPTTEDGVVDPRAWAREVLRDGLMPAVRTSPVVFRAFLRWFNLLATPDALMADTEVMGEVLRVYSERDSRPPEPLMGPATRDEFAAVVSAAR